MDGSLLCKYENGLLAVLAISNRADTLLDLLARGYVPENISVKTGIVSAMALGFSNASNALVLCSVEQTVKERKHSVAIGIVSFVMNVGVFIVTTLLILPYSPDVLMEQVPTLFIIKTYLVQATPWLPVVYMVTMFVTLMDSSQLHAVVSRTMCFYPDTGFFKDNTRLKIVITGLIYFTISILISLLGLRTIVGKGYSLLGYLAVPLIAFPICVLMPLKEIKVSLQKRIENLD